MTEFRGMTGLKKQRRIQMILLAFVLLAASAGLIGYGFRDGINFFRVPSQLVGDPPAAGEVFRLGGLVKEGSIGPIDGTRFDFVITDRKTDQAVRYIGDNLRPDLFDEGQATVATGQMVDGVFAATEILAKHDESYMPSEVIDAMKEMDIYVPPVKN
jgi:cytochrome c-type biogenesis protein CcmE